MQGEALSPVLFSMYVNDFESELVDSLCEPVYLHCIPLLLLMHSHNTVLLSDTAEGLRKMLDALYLYTTKWNIDVNTDTTKIVVFRNTGQLAVKETWKYNGNPVLMRSQGVIASQGRKYMNHVLRIREPDVAPW